MRKIGARRQKTGGCRGGAWGPASKAHKNKRRRLTNRASGRAASAPAAGRGRSNGGDGRGADAGRGSRGPAATDAATGDRVTRVQGGHLRQRGGGSEEPGRATQREYARSSRAAPGSQGFGWKGGDTSCE